MILVNWMQSLPGRTKYVWNIAKEIRWIKLHVKMYFIVDQCINAKSTNWNSIRHSHWFSLPRAVGFAYDKMPQSVRLWVQDKTGQLNYILSFAKLCHVFLHTYYKINIYSEKLVFQIFFNLRVIIKKKDNKYLTSKQHFRFYNKGFIYV